ncbi:hypothetical protein AB0D89_38325 [Streptomyces luteogriseus]|uniref:hypothetical protein n=1 Tax=Streptomyces luteogriseus TaxID=68233 RepID=UPI0033C0A70A
MTAAQWDNLPKLIEFSGGYLSWNVSELLALDGARAAGVRIIERIEQELADRNIGHFPPRIPRDRTSRVLLYAQDRHGLGVVLHLARQLAAGETPEGTSVDDQVGELTELLDMYQRSSEKAAKVSDHAA